MTDVNSVNKENVVENQEDTRDSIIADLKRQIEAVNAKNKELLSEKKSVAARAKEAEYEKAKRDGDYEQLLKSSESHRSQLEQELGSLKTQISNEKLHAQAYSIASELADGHNVKLLSKFIQERLSYVDGEIKVLDKSGHLTVSSLDALKAEFKGSDDYKSLLRGSKASGGNSTGNTSSSAKSGAKVITRAEFDKMNSGSQMAHIKSGGIVVENSSI